MTETHAVEAALRLATTGRPVSTHIGCNEAGDYWALMSDGSTMTLRYNEDHMRADTVPAGLVLRRVRNSTITPAFVPEGVTVSEERW